MKLVDLLDLMLAKMKALADCQERHHGLAEWAATVSRGDKDGGRLDH